MTGTHVEPHLLPAEVTCDGSPDDTDIDLTPVDGPDECRHRVGSPEVGPKVVLSFDKSAFGEGVADRTDVAAARLYADLQPPQPGVIKGSNLAGSALAVEKHIARAVVGQRRDEGFRTVGNAYDSVAAALMEEEVAGSGVGLGNQA